MSFLSPWFLAGALAASLPIVLHLLKRQPATLVRFSAVRLLRSAPVEHARHRRIRNLLLLALRVAALLLLAVAFARPFFATAAPATGVTVVALDTSLSMSAPGRFERARALAKEAVGRVPRGERVALVTFDATARVVVPPSTNRAAAIAAIDNAKVGLGGTSYRAVLAAATALIDGGPGGLAIATDLQQSGWERSDHLEVPEGTRVELLDAGPATDNLALIDLRSVGDQVIASVRNDGSSARAARVRLASAREVGGAPGLAAERSVSIDGHGSADVAFPGPGGSWASAVVEDPGGIPGDDTRYAVLGAASSPPVLVVTSTGHLGRDAFYVAQALSSGAGSAAYTSVGVSGAELQTWDQARVDAHAAVLLLSTRGLEHKGRQLLAEYIRRGGGVLVGGGMDVDGEVVAEALGGVRLTIVRPETAKAGEVPRALSPSDARHPLFRAFDRPGGLALVRFRTISVLRADGCQPLATFTTGEPALVDCEAGRGRAVIMASDLDNRWNDFPLHPTFVPFLHELIRYLSSARPSSSYLVGNVPPGVASTPGVTLLKSADGVASTMIAVNVDPIESAPGQFSADEFIASLDRSAAPDGSGRPSERQEQEDSQQLWRYALALMLGAVVAEGFVAMKAA